MVVCEDAATNLRAVTSKDLLYSLLLRDPWLSAVLDGKLTDRLYRKSNNIIKIMFVSVKLSRNYFLDDNSMMRIGELSPIVLRLS